MVVMVFAALDRFDVDAPFVAAPPGVADSQEG
jgi:hypothetical protein